MPRTPYWPVLLLVPLLLGAGPADDGRWHAGPYSFSDELGGFRITDVEGTGSKRDPVRVRQILQATGPVTMVIRTTGTIRPFAGTHASANGFLYLRLETRNASGLGWIEFEFELQEIRGEPSVFGDGLSFNQRRVDPGNISSDRFATHIGDFEPYDRLLFQDGAVDPRDTATFGFLITDFTPIRTFYLVQDPRIPFS